MGMEPDLLFEWNERKNASNLAKHGISFLEAAQVFDDPRELSMPDIDHGFGEERWLSLGISDSGNVLAVSHTFFLRSGSEVFRLISARLATKREKELYFSQGGVHERGV